MKVRLTNLFFIVTITSIFSCNDDDPIGYKDPALAGYVDRFIEQGTIHGMTITASQWTIEFQEYQDYSGYTFNDQRRIVISPSFWEAAPESAREALVFHELGHALLNRSHKEDLLPNGDAASIMTSNPAALYNMYTPKKRLYYFDELFLPNTIAPDWAQPKTNPTLIFEDTIRTNSGWVYKLTNSPNHEQAISGSIFSSPSSSLAIKSLGSTVESSFSYWAYSFAPTGIPEGTPVEVKIKIKGEGLTGKGASLTIRGDVTGNPYPAFIYNTASEIPLTGSTNGFVERGLKISYFPSQLDKFNFYLILSGSSEGTVYFDDLTVTKYD